MKTKLIFSAIFLITFIFTGCEKSNNELQDETKSFQKKNKVERPFKFVGENVGPTGETYTCTEGEIPVVQEIWGEGNATHMGKVTYAWWHCMIGLNPNDDEPVCSWGPINFTAANGDMVYAMCGEDEDGNTFLSCITDNEPPIIIGEGPGLIIGGTGRFEGATGVLEWTVIINTDPDIPTKVIGEGTIIY
jgi:hypothetical protein